MEIGNKISLRDFIIIIKNVEIYDDDMEDLIIKLLKAGGCVLKLTKNTVKSWIKPEGAVNCSGIKYIKNNIDGFNGITNFFYDGIEKYIFKIIKKDLCAGDYEFDKRFVDLETENEERFCMSLANIFLSTINMRQIKLDENTAEHKSDSKTTTSQQKNTTGKEKENNPSQTLELLPLEHFIDNIDHFGVDIFIGIDTGKYDYTEITDIDKEWVPSVSSIRRMIEFIGSIDHYIKNEAAKMNSDCKNNIEKFMNTFQDFMSEISDLSTTPSFLENIYVNYTEYVPTDKCKLQKIRKEYCEKLTPLFESDF